MVIDSPNKAFARRLEEACDLAPHVPEKHRGRLRWIGDQMMEQGQKISTETVRKWVSGEARPRTERLRALARILRVDEAWLAFGNAPSGSGAGSEKNRTENVEGAPNYVAGLFALNGVNFGWAEGDDDVHFHAIIRGKSRAVFVTVAEESGDELNIVLPPRYEGKVNLVLVKRSPMNYDTFRLPEDLVSKSGRPRGGYIELKAKDHGDWLTSSGNRASKVTDPRCID